MIREQVNDSYATIGAREDIAGYTQRVVMCPNRNTNPEDRIELYMDAATARKLARRLNRWARLVSA